MSTIDAGSRAGKAWLAGAVVASLVGGAATAAFAAWWFGDVGGHCGVVSFYEQAFGVIVVGGWLAGTAVGLLIAFMGRRKSARVVVAGSLIVVLSNVAAVAVCAKVVHGVRATDYTLKTTEHLLGFLAGDDLNARKMAAHALGERRAVEALPHLCAILDSAGEDVNLRHNAAIALGRICAPPHQAGVDVDRALTSLTSALKGRDEYLPHSICGALGEIGDARAVAPLAEFLGDASRPTHAREEAARALAKIGGDEARIALEKALPDAGDESLAHTIRRAIEAARRP